MWARFGYSGKDTRKHTADVPALAGLDPVEKDMPSGNDPSMILEAKQIPLYSSSKRSKQQQTNQRQNQTGLEQESPNDDEKDTETGQKGDKLTHIAATTASRKTWDAHRDLPT